MKIFIKSIFVIALALGLLQGVAMLFSDAEMGSENYQAGSLEIHVESYSTLNELLPNTPESCTFWVKNTGSIPVTYEISTFITGDLSDFIDVNTFVPQQLNPGQMDTLTLEVTLANDISPSLKGESDILEIIVQARQVNLIGGFTDEEKLEVPLRVASPAPTLDILSPASDDVSGEIFIQAEAYDPFGVSGVYFTIDNAPEQIYLEDKGLGVYEIIWDSATLANGTHTLHLVVYDALNQTTSELVDINIIN